MLELDHNFSGEAINMPVQHVHTFVGVDDSANIGWQDSTGCFVIIRKGIN